MSEIIGLIISYVIAYLLSLAVGLPIAYIEIRKLDKHISNKMSTFRESGAARSQSQDEVSAQVDEISESADEISESFDETSESTDETDESFDEIHKNINEINKSLDRMNESMDRTIEFKRLYSEYLDNKIKRIEARENFCESQFWDEKNIH